MSMEEVETLLDSPKLTDHFGYRDKAMLEMMYATGIRVSELIGLTLSDVHLTMGFVRCMGKGSKERIIPIGKTASDAIEQYLEKGRPKLVSKKYKDDSLFLNHHGKGLSRQAFGRFSSALRQKRVSRRN